MSGGWKTDIIFITWYENIILNSFIHRPLCCPRVKWTAFPYSHAWHVVTHAGSLPHVIVLHMKWDPSLTQMPVSNKKKVPFNCLNKSYELKTWVLQCPTSDLWHVTVWIWYSQDYDYVLITIISGRHYWYTHIQTGIHQSHNILCSRRQDWKLNP